MHIGKHRTLSNRSIIIGGGMAGLAAAVCLSSKGEDVLLLETGKHFGGKMRQISSDLGGIDSGPTVFTMKYVFEKLFDLSGTTLESELQLEKATILARHAWDDSGVFDLHADRDRTDQDIGEFFGAENAKGYVQFCEDARHIYETLKDTFMDAQRPGPLELGSRVGITKLPTLWKLKPLSTLWSALENYFSDERLRQLFGRYATYVGSSPFLAPATLMLIAHVEQEGVWLVKGGMYELAKTISRIAQRNGAELRNNARVSKIIIDNGRTMGVELDSGELLTGSNVIYCGDVSDLPNKITSNSKELPKPVEREKRSLSAITWSMNARSSGFPLSRHNVFFSRDYLEEFESIFERRYPPVRPTVYVCGQDRSENADTMEEPERIFCLINAPANGDTTKLTEKELEQCQVNMTATLNHCGLKLKPLQQVTTEPADFEKMFPGSGGALYGRASHGWTASFARPGAKTRIPGLYLAGGSVHPGAGVPMATLSGMLAAEQILKDHVLI